MQGSNSFEVPNTKKAMAMYLKQKVKAMREKWNTGSEYKGTAKTNGSVILDGNKIVGKLELSGQRMWHMEFGKGYSDITGAGVEPSVVRSPMFQEYSKSVAFNSARRVNNYQRFGKAKKKQKTTDRGRSFNIVRIFTRYGQYTDIDNPVNPKTGSGIGGRNGLNTEAFAYHKNGKYKGKTLAMDSSPVIAPILGATTLENPSKTQWKPKDEDKIADILGNGIVKDMAKFLEDALK